MPGEHAREVEATLGVARDEVERLIANLRILTFALVACLIAGIQAGRPIPYWSPAYYFAGCVAYALVLRLLVARAGGARWVGLGSVIADVVAVSSVFVVAGRTRLQSESLIVLYVLAPSIVLLLAINTLRASRLTAVVGTAVGIVMFFTIIRTTRGSEPGELGAASVILLMGFVGVASARRTRHVLDLFARLHLLQRFVPAPLVDRVVRPAGGDVALAGEERTVTLLASDLRGFTAFAEELAPAEVVRQLNAYHAAMLGAVRQHGGTLDKFIGDGMLVVFGLESPAPADAGANAAVSCARAMLDALAGHNAARARNGEPALAAGIGVHTGHVVAGSIGAEGGRQEFTVIGDAVNTASRLESLTKELGKTVLVSAATVERLNDAGGLSALAPVSVRGKKSALDVYALEG